MGLELSERLDKVIRRVLFACESTTIPEGRRLKRVQAPSKGHTASRDHMEIRQLNANGKRLPVPKSHPSSLEIVSTDYSSTEAPFDPSST